MLPLASKEMIVENVHQNTATVTEKGAQTTAAGLEWCAVEGKSVQTTMKPEVDYQVIRQRTKMTTFEKITHQGSGPGKWTRCRKIQMGEVVHLQGTATSFNSVSATLQRERHQARDRCWSQTTNNERSPPF